MAEVLKWVDEERGTTLNPTLDTGGDSHDVAVQPLGSDMADEGHEAASAFLAFFVERCGGLVQADGEGFYRGDTLVVEPGLIYEMRLDA